MGGGSDLQNTPAFKVGGSAPASPFVELPAEYQKSGDVLEHVRYRFVDPVGAVVEGLGVLSTNVELVDRRVDAVPVLYDTFHHWVVGSTGNFDNYLVFLVHQAEIVTLVQYDCSVPDSERRVYGSVYVAFFPL